MAMAHFLSAALLSFGLPYSIAVKISSILTMIFPLSALSICLPLYHQFRYTLHTLCFVLLPACPAAQAAPPPALTACLCEVRPHPPPLTPPAACLLPRRQYRRRHRHHQQHAQHHAQHQPSHAHRCASIPAYSAASSLPPAPLPHTPHTRPPAPPCVAPTPSASPIVSVPLLPSPFRVPSGRCLHPQFFPLPSGPSPPSARSANTERTACSASPAIRTGRLLRSRSAASSAVIAT